MVCNFEITEAQLRAAISAIENSKERGFSDTTAIFHLSQIKVERDVIAEFSNAVILKSHPTDGCKSWGNTTVDMINWYRLVDGRCVADE